MHNLNDSPEQLIHNIMLMENKIDKLFAINDKNQKYAVKQKRRNLRLKKSLLNDLNNIYKD